MGRIQATDLVEIIVGTVTAALVCTWTSGGALPVLPRTLLVFLCMKVSGDLLRAVLAKDETHYLEDILGDLATYSGLAVVSAAAIWAACRYLGGNVEPVFPGAVAHALLTIMPGREQRKQASGG
ncbi:MAG: hypothetical protein ACM3X4_01395 [Ignavibacteriales bacterium]